MSYRDWYWTMFWSVAMSAFIFLTLVGVCSQRRSWPPIIFCAAGALFFAAVSMVPVWDHS